MSHQYEKPKTAKRQNENCNENNRHLSNSADATKADMSIDSEQNDTSIHAQNVSVGKMDMYLVPLENVMFKLSK